MKRSTRATRASIAKKFRAVTSALAALGCWHDERAAHSVAVDKLEDGAWFAWIGDVDDTLGGTGRSVQEALNRLDRQLSARMRRAAAKLARAADHATSSGGPLPK